MLWKVPNMWEGGECWIIGGGPSVPREFGVPEEVITRVLSGELPVSAYSPYLSAIHDKHVIGINAAFLIGDWIDMVFFGDGRFYFDNKKALCAYPKIKVTCNSNLQNKKQVHSVKYLQRQGNHPQGISTQSGTVAWNGNSGAASISLAVQLGVKKIYLLGFDMKVGEKGNQHFHRHYKSGKTNSPRNLKKLPFHRHVRCFPSIAKDAKRLGIEIINVNPDSDITAFKRAKLSNIL